MSSTEKDSAPTIRIESLYALACLTKSDLIECRAALHSRDGVIGVGLDEELASESRIRPPHDIGSAGRASLDSFAGHPLKSVFIFSASVPHDVMVGVEVGLTTPVEACLPRCLEFVETTREGLYSVVSRLDVECLTLTADSASMSAFRELAADAGLSELYATNSVAVYTAPYPYDCLIIVGQSESAVAEIQAAVQNL